MSVINKKYLCLTCNRTFTKSGTEEMRTPVKCPKCGSMRVILKEITGDELL